jgi:hypothetical protein
MEESSSSVVGDSSQYASLRDGPEIDHVGWIMLATLMKVEQVHVVTAIKAVEELRIKEEPN